MKLPAWLVKDAEDEAVAIEGPAIAQFVSQSIVTAAMAGLQQSSKMPVAFAVYYDAQSVATWLQDGFAFPTLSLLCDRLQLSAGTKAKLLADLAACPPVIPVKKAEAV